MTTSGNGEIIRQLRHMVLRGDAADMADDQLLEAFVSRRDAAAFESLVRRHGPMVLGVCRRILCDPHDVDDAFQASFLVLAHKAATVSPRRMVGNWLYGVAHTTAVRLRAANAKRRARERQVAEMPEPGAEQQDPHDDLHQLLDEELARLPDKYRVPVVLCDLEGGPRREVARQLKIPEGTLSSRLTTARRMLAKRLSRRGLAVSGGALAAVVLQEVASGCVPASLVSATVRTATLGAAGQAVAGLIPAQVVALTQGVLKSMFLTKLKAVVLVLLVVVALSGAAGLSLPSKGAESPNPQTGPLPRAVDFGFPIQRADDAKGQTLSLVGFVDAEEATTKYKGLFLKVLMVVAEHFEQITHADQYEGRIEARTVDAKRTGIIREASVSFQVSADGSLFVTVLVNKVKTSGDKSEVIGRDSGLEQVILDMRAAQAQQGQKKIPATTTPSSQPRTMLPASQQKREEPKADRQGATPLKGAWRVVSVKGGEGACDVLRQTDLIFVGERLVAAPSGPDDYAPASVYQVHLGARRPVQEIDFTQKGETGETRLLGIYDVKGDELLLCLSARQGTRPASLEAGQKQALLVARRVKE